MRFDSMYRPGLTFLGVPTCNPDDCADIDILILGTPFDGSASYRSGARFGPSAIRSADYLPRDGSRPHLALHPVALKDLCVTVDDVDGGRP